MTKIYCIMKISAISSQLALLLATIPANATELPALQPPGTRCPMPLLHRNGHQKKPNEAVKILQRRLREYNIHVKVDGFFGRETEDGVIEYQERGNDHDPNIKVDGIVGKDTWEYLLVCPTEKPRR
jgi:peptidoglycan hydrolase-like protein with peptidoglycan-binding domain